MRKYLASLMILVIPSIAFSGAGIKVNIFGKSLDLPNYCELHAERSIVDKKIAVSCTPPDYSMLMEIEIQSEAQCKESTLLESHGVLEKNIVHSSHKDNTWYLEYSMYVPDQEKSLYSRVVRDKDVCFRITSSNKERLYNLSREIWF